MNKRAASLLTMAVTALCAVTVLRATDEAWWETKDWKQWSAKDCDALLSIPPWTQRLVIYQSIHNDRHWFYYVQFLSALPLYQARFRAIQIGNKYDQRDAPQRSSIDQQIAAHLKECDDCILVGLVDEDSTHWGRTSQTADDLKTYTYMKSTNGPTIHPISARFVSETSWAEEFHLVFPRTVEGQPAIRPGDTKVHVQLSLDWGGPVDFDLRWMTYKGKVEY